jgi:hypothetical protein
MLLNSSFPLARPSGFVAFDGGGVADPEVRHDTAEPPHVAITPRLEPELLRATKPSAEVAHGWRQSPTWQPSTGALVRRIEAVVVVAICGYFALGLAGVAGRF